MLTPSSNTVVEPVTAAMLAGRRRRSAAHFSRFRVTEIALSDASRPAVRRGRDPARGGAARPRQGRRHRLERHLGELARLRARRAAVRAHHGGDRHSPPAPRCSPSARSSSAPASRASASSRPMSTRCRRRSSTTGARPASTVSPSATAAFRTISPSPVMQNRVAVEPDQLHPHLRVADAKLRDGSGMPRGQLVLDRGDRLHAAKDAAQPLAKVGWIGHGQRRPGDEMALAVAVDRRDIDAVERSAAHQPQRQNRFCAR